MASSTPRRALVIGNSDGIGCAFTDALLQADWSVSGLSRSVLERDGDYVHVTCNVLDAAYPDELRRLAAARGPFDLVTHCVGIGSSLGEEGLAAEATTFAVNLMSLVQAVAVLLPAMVARRSGHLIGLSSAADVVHIAEAPSYSASKAGYSSYLRGLALNLRPSGVAVTNVRFGFVDTKMAKSDVKPMMISRARAAEVLMRCVRSRPAQVTYPRTAGVAMCAFRSLQDVRAWTTRG